MEKKLSMERPSTDEIRRTIVGFVESRLPRPVAGGPGDDLPLLAGGALDSLGVLELMMFLGQTFAIEVDDADFDAENLATIGSLVGFVERKLQS